MTDVVVIEVEEETGAAAAKDAADAEVTVEVAEVIDLKLQIIKSETTLFDVSEPDTEIQYKLGHLSTTQQFKLLLMCLFHFAVACNRSISVNVRLAELGAPTGQC